MNLQRLGIGEWKEDCCLNDSNLLPFDRKSSVLIIQTYHLLLTLKHLTSLLNLQSFWQTVLLCFRKSPKRLNNHHYSELGNLAYTMLMCHVIHIPNYHKQIEWQIRPKYAAWDIELNLQHKSEHWWWYRHVYNSKVSLIQGQQSGLSLWVQVCTHLFST